MMLTPAVPARGISYFPSIQPSSLTRFLPSVSHASYLGRQLSQLHRMSTTLQSRNEPFSLGTMLKSDSGRTYKIEETLADRRKPLLCVYRARYVFVELPFSD